MLNSCQLIIYVSFSTENHLCFCKGYFSSDYKPMNIRDSMYVGEVRSQSIKQNGEYSLCLQVTGDSRLFYLAWARSYQYLLWCWVQFHQILKTSPKIKVSTVIIYPCTEEELVLEDSRLLQFTKDYKIRLLNNKCWELDGSTDREVGAQYLFDVSSEQNNSVLNHVGELWIPVWWNILWIYLAIFQFLV